MISWPHGSQVEARLLATAAAGTAIEKTDAMDRAAVARPIEAVTRDAGQGEGLSELTTAPQAGGAQPADAADASAALDAATNDAASCSSECAAEAELADTHELCIGRLLRADTLLPRKLLAQLHPLYLACLPEASFKRVFAAAFADLYASLAVQVIALDCT